MNTNRQIKNVQYNIPELVQNAIAAADSQPLDIEDARKSLNALALMYGPRNWTDDEVAQYARETAILKNLARTTGAQGFQGQRGKIDFSTIESAISGVNAYLNRRNTAAHARWTANHR